MANSAQPVKTMSPRRRGGLKDGNGRGKWGLSAIALMKARENFF